MDESRTSLLWPVLGVVAMTVLALFTLIAALDGEWGVAVVDGILAGLIAAALVRPR
ncbi:hypothetical protein GCM10023340_39000 [Nocardioides marinquilinus]|uniref:Uncharacterized protein n=1 Tax=Nocardioides marinquilinus TaxID=1210400 RepID=A0ABP9Q297_9ACTN